MSSQWKGKIIELLKSHPDGLTVSDISKKCNISRTTASLVLAELRGAKEIRIRNVAAAKLHYWKNGEDNG